jgi:hypothetical protein
MTLKQIERKLSNSTIEVNSSKAQYQHGILLESFLLL